MNNLPERHFESEDLQRLRFLAPEATVSAGVTKEGIDFGDADPFGLLECLNLDEPAARELFNDAEFVTRAVAMKDRAVARAYRKDSPLALPPVSLGKLYEFQLSRDKTKGGKVIYRFNGIDVSTKEPLNNGFSIAKDAAGHVLVRNISEDKTITDPETYKALLLKAKRFMSDYTQQLGFRNLYEQNKGSLDLVATSEAESSLNKWEIAQSIGFTLLVPGAVIWGPAVAIYMMNADAKSEDRKLLNAAEQYDRTHPDTHLPANSLEIRQGEKALLLSPAAIPEQFIGEFASVPELDGQYPRPQPLAGGPRRLNNMQDNYDGRLNTGDCEDIKIEANPNGTLRVSNISEALVGAAVIRYDKSEIEICNISSAPLLGQDLNRIYVEEVSKKPTS